MQLLISDAEIYSPEYSGKKDILIGGGSILAVSDNIKPGRGTDVRVINGNGLCVIPGLIDSHVHITGGGGEGGPASRMPELQLNMMLTAGVTTVIGCLGTDGITRSVESVLMKVKSLRAEGVSAWMYTGSYQFPCPSITGDTARDISLFEEIIGIGELALSDHRSSCPTTPELARLAGNARVAGMIAGKAGIINIHLGDAKDPFRPIHEVVVQTELNYKQFLPTHCNRNRWIFEDAKEYGKKGWIDLTTSSWPYYPEEEIKPSSGLKQLLEAGVPVEHITFTSDGCGSLPGFDPVSGVLTKIEMGLPSANLRELKDSVTKEKLSLETALKVLTENPANILKLKGKGRIQPGFDADLLLIDKDFNIIHYIANGRIF